MAQLQDLINGLAATIILYHESQIKNRVKSCLDKADPTGALARAYAINILNEEDFQQTFIQLSAECTTGINYPLRSDFLKFITKEIVALKSVMDRDATLSEAELKALKKKVAHLLIDLASLLKNSKDTDCQIRVNSLDDEEETVTISLKGMLTGAFGSSFCDSGKIVNDEVFKKLNKLNITYASSSADMTKAADTLCQQHQEALSLLENDALRKKLAAAQKRETALTKKLDEANAALKQKTTELTAAKDKEGTLTADLETTATALKQKTTELEKAEAALKQRATELAAAKDKESTLTKELVKTKTELKAAQIGLAKRGMSRTLYPCPWTKLKNLQTPIKLQLL